MDIPIIFIHYGPSGYLFQTLYSAARSNPGKDIFLLGDKTNRHLVPASVKYAALEDFSRSDDLAEFETVFRALHGSRHKFTKHGGVDTWLRFVFRRWFILADFIRESGVKSFWTFDSDSLTLAPLGLRENRFQAYDSTTQCRDCCLNGYVGSRTLVERYTRCIIDLFKDSAFLDAQKKRLEKQAGLAFNEMDAFCEFRRRENVKTFHAARPLEGEFLDDALAFDSKFETSARKVRDDIRIKRLWRDQHGALYAHHLESDRIVRMITANLSWLPDYVGRNLVRFSLTPEQDAKVVPPKKTDLQEIKISQPLTDKITTAIKRRLYEVKKNFGR